MLRGCSQNGPIILINVADADVVVMKKGDRVTGTIVKMEKQSLEIDPDYSGVISIDWKDVHSVTTVRPMSIKLHGNEGMLGNAQEPQSNGSSCIV